LFIQLISKIFCWIRVCLPSENMHFVRLQKILVHPCDTWICVVLNIAESDCADGQMEQAKEQFKCTELCTKYSSSQSVTYSLGTYTLVSLYSVCSGSFFDSCEVSAQVRKANLTVLSGDGNPRTARSAVGIHFADILKRMSTSTHRFKRIRI
jgi:hypothetical protein